ncbi:Cytochrome c [Rubripirellula lacrimiformis]|uniref:Cytochrome c n=1 Tax=Rubripirellula lacrimiformis TaxID=1930273 RepID=A0A517N3Z8_9BACT|nr:c-type cytochrome [Rubripirellula lacrimiformis]QDT01852.1 Cytochrome c [Rubripirellula lacrimiformis]
MASTRTNHVLSSASSSDDDDPVRSTDQRLTSTRHPVRLPMVLAWAALCVVIVTGTLGSAADSPMVAGFDRFARHGEIDDVTSGALLISELSCTACHASSVPTWQPKRGPNLAGVGRRVQLDWLKEYLLSPHESKPGTTMPDVMASLDIETKRRATDALAAYLSSLRQDFPVIKATGAVPVEHEFWNKGDPSTGRELYHQVGCVACHDADADYEVESIATSAIDRMLEELDPEELADLGLSNDARRVESIPLPKLPQKYTYQSLSHFLHSPDTVRPAGRMPSLNLTPQESADIATYLMGDRPPVDAPGSVDDSAAIQRGRQWFASLRCTECHDAGRADQGQPVQNRPKTERTSNQPSGTADKLPLPELPFAKPIGDNWDVAADQSCLNPNDSSTPRYQLDDQQRDAIIHAIAANTGTDAAAETQDRDESSHQSVDRVLLTMNCYGCHQRDGIGGVGRFRKPYFETVRQVDLGDEGRLPPPLHGVGRKLKSEWIGSVLRGDKGTRLRPHMTVRMPGFRHAMVSQLPQQLADADEVDTRNEADVFRDPSAKSQTSPPQTLPTASELAEAGRSLMDGGCVQCHAFQGEVLDSVIGIDIAGMHKRMHPSWFAKFILDPGSLKNRTRMPTFFPDGKSQNPAILHGNTQHQIAAMWAYLKQPERIGLPAKIAESRGKNYELKPTDQPQILRTFMGGVGTHAIAVGFPNGHHFAFDTLHPRVAMLWKGPFLDARTTWFERFAPDVDPLGDHPMPLGQGASVIIRAVDPNQPVTPPKYRFRGYTIDESKTPTFRYQVNQRMIEDRIEPIDGGLRRVVRDVTDALAAADDDADANQADDAGTDHHADTALVLVAYEGKSIRRIDRHTIQTGDRQTGNSLTIHWTSTSDSGSEPAIVTEGPIGQWQIPIPGNQPLEITYRW